MGPVMLAARPSWHRGDRDRYRLASQTSWETDSPAETGRAGCYRLEFHAHLHLGREGRVRHYLGNPLPLVDWIVAGVAFFTALFASRLATVASTLALFSLGFTAFIALVDAGSGPSVSVEFGLPLGCGGCGTVVAGRCAPRKEIEEASGPAALSGR
jgi:hypothetical protein